MRYLLLVATVMAALPLVGQTVTPNGRHYPNLPHGTLAREFSFSDGTRYVLYRPPGTDSIRQLLVFDNPEALDTTGSAYAPWILDNLQAQETVPATAAVFLDRVRPGFGVPTEEVREQLPRLVPGITAGRLGKAEDAGDLAQQIRALASDHDNPRVFSGRYGFPGPGEDATLFSGPTAHFADLTLERWDPTGPSPLGDAQREQMVIVRKGRLSVTLRDTAYVLGPRSVLFVAAGDSAIVGAATPNTTTYRMHYAGPRGGVSPAAGTSFVVEYDNLPFQPHDRGGLRNYFRRATPYCPYYEMHMTTLNPGIKSHEPHVHAAAEVIILLQGKTEMEIGDERVRAAAGDIYYLPSQVPHAIRNLTDVPCTYFAFQWDN